MLKVEAKKRLIEEEIAIVDGDKIPTLEDGKNDKGTDLGGVENFAKKWKTDDDSSEYELERYEGGKKAQTEEKVESEEDKKNKEIDILKTDISVLRSRETNLRDNEFRVEDLRKQNDLIQSKISDLNVSLYNWIFINSEIYIDSSMIFMMPIFR